MRKLRLHNLLVVQPGNQATGHLVLGFPGSAEAPRSPLTDLCCGSVEDLERNDGSLDRPYYMSKALLKILGKKNDASPGNRRKK